MASITKTGVIFMAFLVLASALSPRCGDVSPNEPQCRNCNCPPIKDPVCAITGVTYYNLCLLRHHSTCTSTFILIDLDHKGPCRH